MEKLYEPTELFEFDGKFYIIKRQKYEIAKEIYLERVWFILNNLDKEDCSFEDLEKQSLIWANKKFLGCSY